MFELNYCLVYHPFRGICANFPMLQNLFLCMLFDKFVIVVSSSHVHSLYTSSCWILRSTHKITRKKVVGSSYFSMKDGFALLYLPASS